MYKMYYKMHRGGLLQKNYKEQVESQKQIIKELVFVLQKTKYFKENKIKIKNKNLKLLQSLPIVSYEDIHPWIERTWEGEENVLWTGNIKLFAKSSGTTNSRSKYIPISNEYLEDNHITGGKDMLYSYLKRNPKSKLGYDSVLTISGSIQDIHKNNGNIAGDVSGIIDMNSPWWAGLYKILPKKILGIKSWEHRFPEVLKFIKNKDVKAFVGVTSWINNVIYQSIKDSKIKNALDLWPNLEVFFHGGVSIKPYLKDLKKMIPSKNFKYVEVYNASEGFFAFQDTDDMDKGMLLLCGHGVFYEFCDFKTKKIHTIKNIKKKTKYELIISNTAGLWRYAIGDVVEVVNLNPIRVKVVGRTKAVLNSYGEELMVGNVDDAIKQLNQLYNYSILEYTGTSVFKSKTTYPGHEWIFEFMSIPDDKDLFIKRFDDLLKKVNSDYEAKRKGDMILSQPIVHFVKKDTFYKWMETRGKLGGQNKIPRLSEKRDHLESVLKLINNTKK